MENPCAPHIPNWFIMHYMSHELTLFSPSPSSSLSLSPSSPFPLTLYPSLHISTGCFVSIMRRGGGLLSKGTSYSPTLTRSVLRQRSGPSLLLSTTYPTSLHPLTLSTCLPATQATIVPRCSFRSPLISLNTMSCKIHNFFVKLSLVYMYYFCLFLHCDLDLPALCPLTLSIKFVLSFTN